MINVTLEQLLNSSEGLKGLSQKQLKARCAYTVGKLLKNIDGELTTFNEARMNLITKYGEKDENNELIKDEKDNVHILPENIALFNKELQELLNTSVELNNNKIKISDIDSIEFTPTEMSQLEPFIDLEENE